MSKISSFKGDPQDYLDWFNPGYEKENRILLPGSTFEEKEPVTKIARIPVYRQHELGTSYSQAYIAQDNQDYKDSVKIQPCLTSNRNSSTAGEAMEDISTVAGTDIGDGEAELDPDAQKAQVYLHYDFMKHDEASQKLPVYNWKKEILQKIGSYSVVVIQGHTGCGKSTQVPQFILDDAVDRNQHVNLIVTQPRKIAAITLANRVCDERGWKVGKLVGYQVGLNNMCDLDTRLAYVTTEVFVQKVIHKRSLNDYTHIILDEIHERDQHMDFALLVVKKLLHTVSKHVKIILMSATIDCTKFAKYFSTPIDIHLIPAPVISITDRTPHNVQVYYLESLKPAFVDKRTPPYEFDNPGISQEMFHLALNLVSRFDDLEMKQEKTATHLPSNRGAVLMFLPGLHEIETMVDLLREDAKQRLWEIYPLHSILTLDEQRSVFRKATSGKRKIIVSTGIAESSITVPDIKYIIDFCLTKVLTCDAVTNYTSLKMAWASKASCTQRAGRVGRVSSGRVYRLVEEYFYDDFDEHTTPEMCRTPLNQVVLKIKLLNMGEPQALLALALDPPNMAEIYRTVLVLKQIGALGLKSGGNVCRADGDLTFLGRIAAALPLDPKLSKLIVMGYLFGCLKETVIIAAGLSLRSFHSTPFQDELNAFLSKVSWAHGSFSDCLAIYNAYFVWENYTLKGRFLPTGSAKEGEWARNSYIQLEALKEIHKLVVELNQRLNRLKISSNHDFSPQNKELQAFFIKMCVAGAFYPNYFKRFVPDDYENIICRELNNHDPFSTLVVSGLPAETNFLYDEQLKKMFKKCSNDLQITYEGGKAYIGFPRRKRHGNVDSTEHMKDIPGDFPTAIHLALKMKQVNRTRQNLILHLLSTDEANERLNAIKAEEENLTDFHLKRERIVQCSALGLEPPVMPSPAIHVLNLHVTYVEDAGHFWAVVDDEKTNEDMSYIHHLIKIEMARKSGDPVKKVFPKMPCLAPFTDPDTLQESYYRAKIEEIDDRDSNKLLVYFVDYGNTAIVDISSLRKLPNGLTQTPMLAIPCVLSEIKPSSVGKGQTENVWSQAATTWLVERILNKEFEGLIYSVVHNMIRLQLYEHDDDSDPRVSINDQLIAKGFASKAQEFLMSKQNHENRAILSAKLREGNLTSCPTLKSSISTLSLNVMSSNYSTSSKLNPRRLRGPYTPLEITYVPLFRSGCLKGVKIEPSSVNSTALDLEPQSLHDRMIVAAFVDLNPSESHVILRNSTQMPALPGMLSLCLLMFSPFAELRISDDQSRYTGALFGLGSDPQSGEAIYPDDDMEIAFDFKFTEKDLDKINGLRYLMSSALESYDETTNTNLMKVQKTMRGLILELMSEKRDFLLPVYYGRAYKWNEVPEDRILFPETDSGIEKNLNIVWGFHNGAILRPSNKQTVVSSKLKALRKLCSSLKAERKLPAFTINEFCPACNLELKTYIDLQVHLTCKQHLKLEYQSYGLIK